MLSETPTRRSYALRTDGLGFRNNPRPDNMPDCPRKKILFIGCSFTAGDGVPNENRFTDIVAASIDSVYVYNAAIPGTGNDQQLLILSSLFDEVRPDLLVISPYSGCASRNLLKARPTMDPLYGTTIARHKPYFELGEGGLLLRNSPVPTRRRSNLQGEIAPNYEGASTPVLVKDAEFGFKVKHDIGREKGGVDYPIYDGSDEYGYSLLTRIIHETIKIGRAAKTVLMPLPSNLDMLCIGEPSYVQFFRTTAEAVGVDFLNVYPHFKALKAPHLGSCFIPQDGHYSEGGHQLVAEALLDYLNQAWEQDYK